MQVRIVLTGGPSAGKTTLLNLLSKEYGSRVAIAPEAATILFRGGFPKPVTDDDRLHTQRSVYALQKELELSALEKTGAPLFCDRGSLDGAAYFAGSLKEFCFAMGSTVERELSRYTAVLHLQTAAWNKNGEGFVNTDVRTETPEQAIELDKLIGEVWSRHPNYMLIANEGTFIHKLNQALTALKPFLPESRRYATAGDLLAELG